MSTDSYDTRDWLSQHQMLMILGIDYGDLERLCAHYISEHGCCGFLESTAVQAVCATIRSQSLTWSSRQLPNDWIEMQIGKDPNSLERPEDSLIQSASVLN